LVMNELFAGIEAGRFGPLDPSHLYATGISSGGFMTSRMAVSYRGRFRALAIHSGSYATCPTVCVIPTPLPKDHPPTLFVQGALDPVVPLPEMELYRGVLSAEGFEVSTLINPTGAHAWFAQSGPAILAWFQAHR